MELKHRFAAVVAVGSLGLLATVAIPAAASDTERSSDSTATVLTDALSSPKGLAVNWHRNLVVAQGAFGAPGPVIEYVLHGSHAGDMNPLTDVTNLTDVAISPKDGTGWGIGPDGHVLHLLRNGTVDDFDIPGYQANDPDHVDTAEPPDPGESNPYGLTVAWNGDALVTDAANNDLLRITAKGDIKTVARFDVEWVGTDMVVPEPNPDPNAPPAPPLPPYIKAEAVPTTVTIGPDGYIYVGELKGFPFRPGSSRIWRIKQNAKDGWCSVRLPDPSHQCSMYADGFTAIQDIAFDKSNGKLYVYELAADGVAAFEAGLAPEGVFPPAVLLEVKQSKWGSKRTELVAGQLSQPGGVVVTGGRVYVTDSVFTGGRLLRIDSDGHASG